MSEPIKISVLRKSQPIHLEVEKGEELVIYVKEMTGAQRDEYFNRAATKAKTDDKGEVVGMRDYKGLFSSLLAFCVYDADGKLVPEKDIQEWPDSAQRELHRIAKELNGLEKPADSEGNEKN